MDDTHADFQFLLGFRFLNDKSIPLVPINDYKIEVIANRSIRF
ncbi:Putative protein [Zobellia galactanivorans]|uniref:Uncharacterized protein n=1 Tax=Zobellia galactanivorans (strain DSM 12802 / CCUG 47099 / CIP 106680 / NCIMB 13871 / Dsij) TaxID=63186 RepID=G0L0N3_ZOBGA|nr:Putative protein [Zobellia galactanivorans]